MSEESKAYKLYDPVEEKIIVRRDVVFEESKGWKWNEKSNTEVIEIEGDSDSDSGGNNIEMKKMLKIVVMNPQAVKMMMKKTMSQIIMMRHLLQG